MINLKKVMHKRCRCHMSPFIFGLAELFQHLESGPVVCGSVFEEQLANRPTLVYNLWERCASGLGRDGTPS
jgi:hypothetical protein